MPKAGGWCDARLVRTSSPSSTVFGGGTPEAFEANQKGWAGSQWSLWGLFGLRVVFVLVSFCFTF